MTLSTDAESVRHRIYAELATHGALPEAAVLSAAMGLSEAEYRNALAELADHRHIVLKDGAVEMAHPFATRSFGFSVMGPETLWWGGCAWDSFAIPHLVPTAREVVVATTCPACETAHAWVVTDRNLPTGTQVAHFLTPVDRIWPDAAHACDHQSIFCSEECVDAWLERTGHARGSVLSLEQLWNLAAH